MKALIILTILLIGTAFAYQPLTGEIKKCASDLQRVIKLVEQIKKNYKDGDISAIINDAALLVSVGEQIASDCNFQGEIQEEFSVCFEALQDILVVGKKISKDFLRKNPYEAMQKFVESIDRFQTVQEECPKSKEEIIERISGKKNLEMRVNVEDISSMVENMGFEAFRPIACSHDVYVFGRAAIRYVKAYSNDTLEQKVEGLFGLLERVGPLLDDCGIQVPSWLNNTVVIEACAESVVNGFQLVVHTIHDIENKNSTLTIIGDIVALAHQVVLIRDKCSGLVEEEEEVNNDQVLVQLASSSNLGWTPTYPFNITQCLQATTDFSALFGQLWNAINTGQSTGNVIGSVSQIVIAVEPLLRTCGENQTANFISKEVPEVCLVSISDIVKTVADIYEHQENTVYVLTALTTLYQNFVKLRDNCPFLQGVLPELPDYDFENHKRIEKEVLTLISLNQQQQTAEESGTKLFQFNVTRCIQSSEKLSAEVDNFKALFFVHNGAKRNPKALTDSVIKIKELLHVFLPACGFDEKEKMLESLLPTSCVESSQKFMNLSFEAAYGDKILPEIIEMLPEIYLSLVDIEDKCPKVSQLIEKASNSRE